MKYAAHILDRRTGERVIAPQDQSWTHVDGGTREFWWAEGNYSCDCNRYAEFFRAKGVDVDDEDWPCSYEDFWPKNRFAVKCVTEDGAELYRDEEWVEP